MNFLELRDALVQIKTCEKAFTDLSASEVISFLKSAAEMWYGEGLMVRDVEQPHFTILESLSHGVYSMHRGCVCTMYFSQMGVFHVFGNDTEEPSWDYTPWEECRAELLLEFLHDSTGREVLGNALEEFIAK
jgi:hypothetical protein